MDSKHDTKKASNDFPIFLQSSPIGEDQLEGKAQEHTAESIAELIKKNETENKLIGLDGAWGSGKSNVIKILEKKLSKKYHFFIYDAWGHQEDLQRRSFLEELTEDLCKCEIIDNPADWKEKLKDLLSRKRETKTKTIPKLSNGLIITILIAVLMPFAQTMSEITDEIWLKIIITIAPLGFGVLVYLFASLKDKRWLSFSDIYAIYKGKELSNETHVTISEKEPSVKEFQKWMTDLSDALTTKKLVVVFDNMDRLPSDKVRELWSSIYTFFAEDRSNCSAEDDRSEDDKSEDGRFKNIWVIVPFDRKHIATAFEGKSTTSGDKEKISEEFLSKSFSIIYRVAPPILTDWKKFLDSKFEKAFGENEKEELKYVRKIFDNLQKEITPRNIIAFINEIISLRQIAGEEIRLRYMAVFVLAKKEILSDPVNMILDHNYLNSAEDIFAEDNDLPNHIASLVYQVPLKSASQVMLTRAIQNALNGRNISRLTKLAGHPNFIDILEKIVDNGDLNIDDTTFTLAELEKQDSIILPKDRMSDVWDDLCTIEIKKPLSEQHFTDTHKVFLEKCSNQRSVGFVEYLVDGITKADKFDGGVYYQALSHLHGCVQKNKPKIDMLAMLQSSNIMESLERPPAIFVDYVIAAQSDYKKFKLKCNEDELLKHIIEKIPNNLAGLSGLSVVSDEYNLAPIIDQLKKDEVIDSLTAEDVSSFYEFYKALYISYKNIFEKELVKAIKPERLGSLLSEAKEISGSWFELLAMLLANPKSWDVNNVMATFSNRLYSMGQDIINLTIDHIAERIEYYNTYGSMLLNYPSQQTPILKAVLRQITINPPRNDSRLNIGEILKNYTGIQLSLAVPHEDFLKTLSDWTPAAKKYITTKNILDYLTDYDFFKYIVEVDCRLSDYLVETMIEKLNSLSVNEWQDNLRDVESFIYKVTHLFLDAGKLEHVPDHAITVYKELLIETAKGEFDMSDDRWRTFYDKTDKRKLRPTAKNIRDIFINDIPIDSNKFLFFRNLLLSHGDLDKRSGDVVRRILTPVGEYDDCLTFIVDNSQRFVPIVKNAGDDAADFIDIVKQKLEESPDDENLKRFTKAIEVQVEED